MFAVHVHAAPYDVVFRYHIRRYSLPFFFILLTDTFYFNFYRLGIQHTFCESKEKCRRNGASLQNYNKPLQKCKRITDSCR